jgi:hypothetical protein
LFCYCRRFCCLLALAWLLSWPEMEDVAHCSRNLVTSFRVSLSEVIGAGNSRLNFRISIKWNLIW